MDISRAEELYFPLTLTLSPIGGEGINDRVNHSPEAWATIYFFSFLGGEAVTSLHMVPDSPQAVHFLGLQRVSMLLPHFSQVKTAMDRFLRLMR